jgi:hypothetical protein
MSNDKGGRPARVGVRLPQWQLDAMRYLAKGEGVTTSDAFVAALSCVLEDPTLYAHLRSELGKLRTTPKAPAAQRRKASDVQHIRKPQAGPSNREIA